MKQILMLITIMAVVLLTQAQPFNLSGKIKKANIENLSLQLLYAEPYTRNIIIDLPLDEDNRFDKRIDIPYPLYAILKYDKAETRLLLSPGKSLFITIDSSSGRPNVGFTGSSKTENQLLQQLNLVNTPFYMVTDEERKRYASMSLAELTIQVLEPIQQQIKLAEQKIAFTAITPLLQFMLLNEVRYVNQSYLYDFSDALRWANNRDAAAFKQKVLTLQPLPGNATLLNSPFANMMLSNYSKALLMDELEPLKSDPAALKERAAQLLGMSFDSLQTRMNRYGERYVLDWLYAKNQLSENVQDKLLFNLIMNACDNNELTTAVDFLDTLQQYFAHSQYLLTALPEVRKLQARQAEHQMSSKIVFPKNTNITLEEMRSTYKGKWVYLDIWGTWCGPCKAEMKFAPGLKEKLKDSNIVFVYLAVDEDSKDQTWREYVQVSGLEGEHYRLTSTTIPPYWKEIAAAGGITDRYPTYVLLNPEGKIVEANAERPSQLSQLITQIKQYMDAAKKE